MSGVQVTFNVLRLSLWVAGEGHGTRAFQLTNIHGKEEEKQLVGGELKNRREKSLPGALEAEGERVGPRDAVQSKVWQLLSWGVSKKGK